MRLFKWFLYLFSCLSLCMGSGIEYIHLSPLCHIPLPFLHTPRGCKCGTICTPVSLGKEKLWRKEREKGFFSREKGEKAKKTDRSGCQRDLSLSSHGWMITARKRGEEEDRPENQSLSFNLVPSFSFPQSKHFLYQNERRGRRNVFFLFKGEERSNRPEFFFASGGNGLEGGKARSWVI